jgi:thioesterase domain-containing protein
LVGTKKAMPYLSQKIKSTEEIQNVFESAVPLSKALGICVNSYDAKSLSLSAPLAPNINKHSTVFAGSQSAIGIAAGWALVYSVCQDYGIKEEIVASKSSIRFLRPLPGDFIALARWDEQLDIDEVKKRLSAGRNARLEIPVELICDDEVCSTLSCGYVLISEKPRTQDT